MGRQETVQLHKESAGLQNKRGSRVDTAKAKTAGSTRPKLPAGPRFMPRMGMKKLERLIRATKESVERARLQAAWMRKMGMSIREIARRLFKSYSTVRDWLVKMRRRGPRGRFNKRRGRRKRILNNAILKEMRGWLSEEPEKYGFKSGCWHLDMIKVVLERDYGAVCSDRTLRRTLRKIHFSYRKASRIVPHNSAGREKQEEFMRMAGNTIADLRKKGYTILAEDEFAALLWAGSGCARRPTGGRETLKTRFSNKSVKVFCAVGEDVLLPMPADSANSDEFIDFLDRIHRAYGKAVLILDNASYHKSGKVRKKLEEMNGDIELIFLPPYTPQLNPAEVQVAAFKKRLAGRCFDSDEDLKQAIRDLADAGEVKPVKLMDYMLPAKADALEDSWHRFLKECALHCA